MASVMDGAGKPAGLGRGNQDAKVTAGNTGLRSPLTTSTYDARDAGHSHLHENIAATRETPAAPPSKGLHDRSKMGG